MMRYKVCAKQTTACKINGGMSTYAVEAALVEATEVTAAVETACDDATDVDATAEAAKSSMLV